MKSAGPLFLTATLLAAAGQAQDAAVADKPYASIVSRNMFGLVPIPVVDPATTAPPEEPPPKITPNGTMTIFGKLEALFKVANKGKPGQPAKEDSYVLSEGERQDDITVIKINQADGIITFNNHGKIEDLALVPAANTTAPAGPGGPGGPGGAAPSGAIIGAGPRQSPLFPADRSSLRGRPAGRNPNPGNPGTTAEPNFGGNNPPAASNQQPKTIEEQVMSAAREMAVIEQNRIATQDAVDVGLMPPLPPTLLTPPDATAHDGAPLIAPPVEVPPPATRR